MIFLVQVAFASEYTLELIPPPVFPKLIYQLQTHREKTNGFTNIVSAQIKRPTDFSMSCER